MSTHLADLGQAGRLLWVQIGVSIAAGLILWFYSGVTAYSGLIGGMIAAAGNGVFAFRVFASYRAQEPGRLLARFYSGEILKLVVTGLMFAATILWVDPLSVGALFGVFFLVTMMPMFVSHFLR